MRSGDNANHGGVFAAAHATDACVERARASVARLLGAEPARRRLRPVDDRDDDAALRRRRAHARAGRRGRRHAPGPRRERPPVGDRGRARGRHRPLGRAGPRDARAAGVRDRGRALGPHALGRGDRRVQRVGHGAGARRDRRRRARRGRARLDRRGRGLAAPRALAARARGGHARLLGLQVVRAAHRHPLRGARAAGGAGAGQAHRLARRGARPLRAGHAPVRVARGRGARPRTTSSRSASTRSARTRRR